jgi:nitroreductase
MLVANIYGDRWKMNTKDNMTQSSIFQLIQTRRSIRKFIDQVVEREKIQSCIEAARLAPSAENVQPCRFLVLDERDLIAEFSEKAFSGLYRFTRWAAKAPVIICICAELDWLANRLGKQIQGTSYYLIDVGIAGEHLVLQAEALGLGSCWIGWFDAKKAKKFLNVPNSWRVVALLTLGYPEYRKGEVSKRQPLEKVIFFNRYKK